MRRGRGEARPEPGWKSPFESSDLSAWLAGKVKVLRTYALVSLLAFYPIKIPAGESGAAPPASWVLRGCGTRSPVPSVPNVWWWRWLWERNRERGRGRSGPKHQD